MVSRAIPVDPFDLIIFGGTGDLAERKIIPALFRRFRDGQIPDDVRIVGAARGDLSQSEYRAFAEDSVRSLVELAKDDQQCLERFLSAFRYVQLDALGDKGWSTLAEMVDCDRVNAFYFSVGPNLFGPIAERLNRYGLSGDCARIVVEKPFGHDIQTARELNETLARHFDESQIYRIDHYLGKETVQNLMAVRFGNMLFEPLWNSQYVDHIQITVAESIGVKGREEYYDRAGAMRDMVQNHMMQLLCLIAMEPPARFEPDAVRDEKLKVIRALDRVSSEDLVRGQYRASGENSEQHGSFADEVANADTTTESFIALKTHISNWRWAGTPFYLRTGKRLRARTSEISIVFKETPHSIFGEEAGRHRNVLSIRLQPNEGIDLGVTIKEPGPGGMRLIDVPLDMSFAEALGPGAGPVADAYERLIMDVIRGNQTLFMRGDEVEAAWAWTDPIISEWTQSGEMPKEYDPGGDGPVDALALMHRDGRSWLEIRE